EAGVAVLLDKDPAVVESAVRSLIGKVPSLSPPQHKALADHLLQITGNKKAPLAPTTEAAAVRLLAVLDDPRAGAALWDRVVPPAPTEVRAAALQALGKWVTSPAKQQLEKLFTCAADRDFRIAAPALVMLKGLPVTDRSLPEWLELLRTGDVTVRQLALEKVGDK